jgi:hypothetical protein
MCETWNADATLGARYPSVENDLIQAIEGSNGIGRDSFRHEEAKHAGLFDESKAAGMAAG